MLTYRPMNMPVALRALRSHCGLKQGDVQTRSGLSRAMISELEHGKKNPSLETLQKLSQCFGIPVSVLCLFGESIAAGEALDGLPVEFHRALTFTIGGGAQC